jgi:hypothetical protein
MRARGGWLEGPILLAWALLGLALLCAAVVTSSGVGEPALRALVRATAGSSLALFVTVFAASGLHRLLRRPASAWLLRNRRWVGLSMAASHAVHLAAIATLAARWPAAGAAIPMPTRLVGSFGTLALTALVVTSNERAVARLGAGRWRTLHRAGCWVLWLVFALSYAPRATSRPAHALALALLLGVAALRGWGRFGERTPRRGNPNGQPGRPPNLL